MSKVFGKLDPLIMGSIFKKQENMKKQVKKNKRQNDIERVRNDELVNANGRSLLSGNAGVLSGRPEAAGSTLLGG